MRLKDIDSAQFSMVGTVRWDPLANEMLWTWASDVPAGNVVYVMAVDGEVKKVGIAEDTSSSTFQKRMLDEFRVARQVIVGPIPGKPLPKWRLKPLDPFKKNAPPVLLAGLTVNIWAKLLPTPGEMRAEETRLNNLYRGEWVKEGWTRSGERRLPEGDAC